jgi:hypothetical protein
VSVVGAWMQWSTSSVIGVSAPPVKATVTSPLRFAASSARSTFGDVPLVVRPIATSPRCPSPSTCRAKMSANA